MSDRLWEAHGKLRVSENGHFLEHEDGTGLFVLADTAWRLTSLSSDDLERYLANRKSHGFNTIMFKAIDWHRSDPDVSPPFAGSGPPFPEMRPVDAYWDRVDEIIRQSREFGLYAAMLTWWGPDADEMFADPQRSNYELGRMLGERYRDEPHLIWVASGEYHKPNMWDPPVSEDHLSNLVRVVDGIRETDTGNHLMTIHPLSFYSSSEEFHDAEWLDFNMVQTHVKQGYIDHLVYEDWQREPAKPTFNSEPWYEGEEELYERRAGVVKTHQRGNRYDTAWIQRYQAYWSVFYGGFGYAYGHMNIWTMTDLLELYSGASGETRGVLLDSALNAKGVRDLKHLRALMESYPIQSRVPDPALITTNTRGTDETLSPNLRCATRDADGRWAMVYSTRGEVIRVRMARLTDGKGSACWFDPRTGERKAPFETGIDTGAGAEDRYFNPPDGPADGSDWVLVLDVEA